MSFWGTASSGLSQGASCIPVSGSWSSEAVSGRDLSVWRTLPTSGAPHKGKNQANSTRKVLKCELKSAMLRKVNASLSAGQKNTRSGGGI